MRMNYLGSTLKAATLVVGILLFGAFVAYGQQQVSLTAGPTSITLPDGTNVPMWGYSCGTAVVGSTAICAKLNPDPLWTGWSPVVITIPTGQALQINLTNNLSFLNSNSVPTSLVIVGQVGGGLGTSRTTTPPPDHSGAQQTTWPVWDPSTTGTPPTQGRRVQSMAAEVLAGATTSLTWSSLRPGTYLIESGTHPSIQGPMGLFGMLVVTDAATGTAYPGVTYNADLDLLFSEIDPVQNRAVDTAVNTAGFDETAVWSGQKANDVYSTTGCGVTHTCYPPAVNYDPRYFLINGVAFDRANAQKSYFSASPAGQSGTFLLRFVNAGLRMHIPSVVGAQAGTAAVPGFSLLAEDGNVLPGTPLIQSEVFLSAGKTYDVAINAAAGTAYPVYDRQLSLTTNNGRDGGMQGYVGPSPLSGGALTVAGSGASLSATGLGPSSTANPDTYNSVISGQTLIVSDPGKGVIANDVNVYGVKVSGAAPAGLTLNPDGTFVYSGAPTSFTYCGNGATSGAACTTVTLGAAPMEGAGGITVRPDAYTSNVATALSIKAPGVLANDTDAAGYPLTIAGVTPGAGLTLTVDPNGGFNASVSPHAVTVTATFTYRARNSQGTSSAGTATVTLTFPAPSNLNVTLLDGKSKTALPGAPQDFRWIIEEDRTFYIDPACRTNPPPASCGSVVPTFGTNFHTSYMPVVAQGCTGPSSCESGQTVFNPATGTHVDAVCDVGNGGCRPGVQKTPVLPSQAVLDHAKRYYISVLPGDAIDSDAADTPNGHQMGGASIAWDNAKSKWVTPGITQLLPSSLGVIVEPLPLTPAQVTVFVFEDDFPLNGEHDAGGGIDVLAPNEAGLGGFNITLQDDVGGSGDSTGQMTYDEFNMPLSNSLAGTIDPVTKLDACPISKNARAGVNTDTGLNNGVSETGITGMIPTCPKYESDGVTLSPLAGQAIIKNLPPGRYGVVAVPGADRIAKGEEWLQTNTLDGGPALDAFIKVGEPGYFQEYGPAGYHVAIGFANPKIINDRKTGDFCATFAGGCADTVTGKVTGVHMSRTPDERLYSTGTRDTFGYTQCFASLGSPDGGDFAFAKCDENGIFTLAGIPAGDWRLTIFDQWNDQIVDGISTPVRVNSATVNLGDVAVHQWKSNLITRTFFDANGDGVSQDSEAGLSLVPTNVRFRDGSFSNFNSTDLNGFAGFNEVFPLFNWYVVETDSTRFKNTGTHVVYDAGGPVDGSPSCGLSGYPPCGTSTIGRNLARTKEDVSLPAILRVPGARYCASADCPAGDTAGGSTGRVDPAWVQAEAWQGFIGQNSFLEFGKKPFGPTENGGIHGHVVYASTRPFDDPALLLQLSWEPLVPHVKINLYKEGTAPDGSLSLAMVDTTESSSWDDWAQGFRSNGVPNMNCPGQGTNDLFYFTLFNQPNYLNPGVPLPNNSQFKCFDGLHNFNQLQPAPYDGMYQFPSIIGRNPTTGAPAGTGSTNGTPGSRPGTNCTICTANPDDGTPMLPPGKYVVEMVVPPGYELVKEEDKNILLGDAYVAPVTQQFAGLGAIYIMPDQAEIASLYNPNNPLNSTTNEGAVPRHEGDTGSVETFWPCVGASRIVPEYMSLFPGSGQVAPFAGAMRNLCDRKEVTLENQMSALAKFYVFSSTHVAAHYTGIITDDFTAEFDPFSPTFGEKFSPPDMPVSVKDWAGNEIGRVYADQWGTYNGLTYSSWTVNPPDPSGFLPTMMVMCMNDAGSGTTPDPLFQPQYSQFCYEIPFMPGQTQYMDTPVVAVSAFAGSGYNNPDCAYPDATPAIREVDGDGVGPWVSASGHTLTIYGLGDQQVNNYGYAGPSATTTPFNRKKVTRHFGFGAAPGTVTIGGVSATVTGWSDTQITVTVPNNVPACAIQQQQQYGGPTGNGNAERCGELVITAANGKKSVDSVTVTVGSNQSKPPTRLAAGQTIQSAIDAAFPGDLIIVPPGVYNEIVIMWKPVRLQGVGAASSTINANAHPAGEQKLDAWRRQVLCLFGLAPDGTPGAYNPSCGAGWAAFKWSASNPQVDRLPLEATVGWDATLNGNLAELLQEPTLMGAYEGAAITVLSKGVRFPAGSDPFAADTFPDGTTLLTTSNQDCGTGSGSGGNANPFPSSFWCNPSRIDGLGLTNSSQGGGGIFVHGWGHNMEIANNRIFNNTGSLAGGITIGQGEHPGANLGGAGVVNAAPGSCQTSAVANLQLPYCFDEYVNVHHNAVTLNSSIGDELFSATPAGAGGVTFSNGADYYQFQNNWVCGNLSTGDGGGFAQVGFIYNGDIERNTFLFNQSTNPTIPTNGGGIVIQGAPDVDLTCPGPPDSDCPALAAALGDGAGPGLKINANLILGNGAESGAGGGLRMQGVNGAEVGTFPTTPSRWYSVDVTNNVIANNVAGWDGAGVSLSDALVVNFINNTVISNDSTASSGVLFGAYFANQSSAPHPDPCTINCGTDSAAQPAGISIAPNSASLIASLPATVTCPAGHSNGGTNPLTPVEVTNGSCRQVSFPILYNNVIWENRPFHISVGALSAQYQQSVVRLVPTLNQPQTDATTANGAGQIITGGTGACVPQNASTYWDIGVRGDTGPANHSSGFTLTPVSSVLTNGYGGNHNSNSNPTVAQQYCNGSRVPPELGSAGYNVPPGTNEGNVPVPIFNLTAGATVDEGNNWINISWGPLSLTNSSNGPANGTVLGNYALASGSPAINYVTAANSSASYGAAPSLDFFGNARKTNNAVDAGAVEFMGGGTPPPPAAPTLASIAPASGAKGAVVNVTLTGANLTGATAVTVSGSNGTGFITVSNVVPVDASHVTATFTIPSGINNNGNNANRSVTVTTPGGTSNAVAFAITG